MLKKNLPPPTKPPETAKKAKCNSTEKPDPPPASPDETTNENNVRENNKKNLKNAGTSKDNAGVRIAKQALAFLGLASTSASSSGGSAPKSKDR